MDDAGARGDVGEVGDPAAVRGWGDEGAVHEVRGPNRSGDAGLTHETFDGAAGHRGTLTVQVPPDLPPV
ncbi:hypothetical protein GCM10010129_73420 [Streptomyces fumigatiscleroticus]|nr:hypothetical protein GCM10010129_73420 [Streptomyces fumigatiscleroticus]